jgi:4,5-dihydroxyphthalate decarboxylase
MNEQALELSLALTPNPRGHALIDGRIVPEGIRVRPMIVHASELYWRQLQFAEFDVSEMSLSSLIIAISHGDTRFAAIPAFTMRRFFHTGILVRRDVGIDKPADLRGKRVGVPEYQMTSAIWSRGILQHEFDVAPNDIEWFMERMPDRSHGGATGFTPPKGLRLNQIPASSNIGEMMIDGTLDATLLYITDRNLVDRSRIELVGHPKVRHLFEDQAAERRRYYEKTGIYPINHVLIVRRSLLERYSWVALNLYNAFVAAKEALAQDAQASLQPLIETGALDPATVRTLRSDPMSYGLKEAGRVVEAIAQYQYEQGLTERRVALDEIFAPSTLFT